MQKRRSWLSLVGYCLLTTIGTALAFALILAGGSVALASHQGSGEAQDLQENAPANPRLIPKENPQLESADLTTVSGLVTDSYCGARHMRRSNLTPAECSAVCIRAGANFVLVDGERVYRLSGGNDSLGKLLGVRANVTGTLNGDTIRVSSAGAM